MSLVHLSWWASKGNNSFPLLFNMLLVNCAFFYSCCFFSLIRGLRNWFTLQKALGLTDALMRLSNNDFTLLSRLYLGTCTLILQRVFFYLSLQPPSHGEPIIKMLKFTYRCYPEFPFLVTSQIWHHRGISVWLHARDLIGCGKASNFSSFRIQPRHEI